MNEFLEFLKRNKKRVLVWGTLGVLLATLVIWFTAAIWNPFALEVSDLLVYAPEDCDYVLFSRDFPRLVRGLEDRDFIRAVDEHPGLQRWLAESETVAATGIIPRLREASTSLRDIDTLLPFELSLLGDVSGKTVLLAGYEPEKEGEAPGFLAVIQPESTMARMAVNALLSPTLCSLFIEKRLPEGATVEHFNWGARLDLPLDGETLGIAVARVEAAVVIGTRVDAVAELVRGMAIGGVPLQRSARLNPGWVWQGAETSGVNLMVRSRIFEERVDIREKWLGEMWGPELTQVFCDSFPEFLGRDLYLQLDLDRNLHMKSAIGIEQRRPPDLFSRMEELDRDRIEDQLDGIIRKLPHYVFGYGLCGAEPADLVAFALGRPTLIDRDQKELLYELLARLDRFKKLRRDEDETPDLTGPLIAEVDRLLARDVGFILFKKQRDEEVRHSEPGVAVVLRVEDPAGLDSFLAELEVAAEEPFHRFDEGPFTFWQVVRDTFLDDRENNKPAFARIGDYLVVTNWVQLFVDIRAVMAERQASLPTRDVLEVNLEDLPLGSRCFFFLDPEQLYAHMDRAKEGWIAERSSVNDFEKLALRRAALDDWLRLPEPRPDQETWTDRAYRDRLARLEAGRSEAIIRARIDRNLNYFRAAFAYLFVSVGRPKQEFQFDFRLAAEENY